MEIISNNKTATNTVEVEFKTSAEEFEQAVQAAYLKKKKNITTHIFTKKDSSENAQEVTMQEKT